MVYKGIGKQCWCMVLVNHIADVYKSTSAQFCTVEFHGCNPAHCVPVSDKGERAERNTLETFHILVSHSNFTFQFHILIWLFHFTFQFHILISHFYFSGKWERPERNTLENFHILISLLPPFEFLTPGDFPANCYRLQ